MIARANGVGPKLASRIVNELKDKAGGLTGLTAGAGITGDGAVVLPGSVSADAVSALQNLVQTGGGSHRRDPRDRRPGRWRRLG